MFQSLSSTADVILLFSTVTSVTIRQMFIKRKALEFTLNTQHKLRFCASAGVKVTLSALIDGKNFNAGGHKVGMGFELEA